MKIQTVGDINETVYTLERLVSSLQQVEGPEVSLEHWSSNS